MYNTTGSNTFTPRADRLNECAAKEGYFAASLTNESDATMRLWLIPAAELLAAVNRAGYEPTVDRGTAYHLTLAPSEAGDLVRQLRWDVRRHRAESDAPAITRATFVPLAPVATFGGAGPRPERDANDEAAAPPVGAYSMADFIRATSLTEETAAELRELLDDKPQLLLYGPPGTGKTYIARELAKLLTGLPEPPPERMQIVQFHPAYGYEDFIEGIRPESKPVGEDRFAVDYPVRPGAFQRFCQAAADVEGPCVFIIDEINRGNIPRVFGELMLLLEYRDLEVPLAYSGRPFRIPRNVYLIGTMNTADRSIALVDFALRRRFHFFQCAADPDLLGRWLAAHPVQAPYLLALYRRLTAEAIDDPDFRIGPSHFMRPGLNEEQLRRIWQRTVEPYLAEYHFGERSRYVQWRWDGELVAGIRGRHGAG
jgi:5-methylcytosine-specific restriction protein B